MDKDITNIIKILANINKVEKPMNIMEICGTHTNAISKFGIRNALNKNINLISGPGCPVCVTPNMYIDYINEISMNKDFIVTTYGDMIRVPGSRPDISLENSKAQGADVRIVYSSMDALNIAEQNKDKQVVFLGIGFETTTPHTAVAVKEAEIRKLNNFFVLSLHKIVEPVMRSILEDKELSIDGFICPGHVAAIIGEKGFEFLNEYNCSGAIAGFEAEDIVEALYTLTYDISSGNKGLKNCYRRLVKKEGNKNAEALIEDVFTTRDDSWRGMGIIKKSGLKLKEKYEKYDIEKIYPNKYRLNKENSICKCGEVLKGRIKPYDCELFAKVCCPENPIGPCMVSSEGSCAAYYKYC